MEGDTKEKESELREQLQFKKIFKNEAAMQQS